MSITSFTIECAKTINLGNYQNIKVGASVTFSIDPEVESYVMESERAQDELRRLIEATYKAQKKGEGL